MGSEAQLQRETGNGKRETVIRLGALGGTFNPIHFGHMHIARSCRQLFSLTQVHFVVASRPPHKASERLIPFEHRYAMVSLATAGIPCFIPSLIELESKASPYSIDTMRKLEHHIRQGNDILYFIAGGDSLAEIKTWRENESLLDSYSFIFVLRSGIYKPNPEDALPRKVLARVRDLSGMKPAQIKKQIAEEEKSGENRIYIVDLGAPDISATRIRAQAGSGNSIRSVVPAAVCRYIKKLHLYGA
jgi:nicotinate-nucleotide adenylyltransferase